MVHLRWSFVFGTLQYKVFGGLSEDIITVPHKSLERITIMLISRIKPVQPSASAILQLGVPVVKPKIDMPCSPRMPNERLVFLENAKRGSAEMSWYNSSDLQLDNLTGGADQAWPRYRMIRIDTYRYLPYIFQLLFNYSYSLFFYINFKLSIYKY